MNISFLFAWYDLWVGFFWDRKAHWLYILPLPCMGVVLKFSPPVMKVQRNGKLWCVVDPEGIQMGEPFGSSRAAYERMWYMYTDPSWAHYWK